MKLKQVPNRAIEHSHQVSRQETGGSVPVLFTSMWFNELSSMGVRIGNQRRFYLIVDEVSTPKKLWCHECFVFYFQISSYLLN